MSTRSDYIESVRNELKRNNIEYMHFVNKSFTDKTEEEGFIVMFSIYNNEDIKLFVEFLFIELNIVKISCCPISNIKSPNRTLILEMINKLNNQYRFINLVLDDSNEILLKYQSVLYGNKNDSAKYIIKMIYIIHDTIKQILKELNNISKQL